LKTVDPRANGRGSVALGKSTPGTEAPTATISCPPTRPTATDRAYGAWPRTWRRAKVAFASPNATITRPDTLQGITTSSKPSASTSPTATSRLSPHPRTSASSAAAASVAVMATRSGRIFPRVSAPNGPRLCVWSTALTTFVAKGRLDCAARPAPPPRWPISPRPTTPERPRRGAAECWTGKNSRRREDQDAESTTIGYAMGLIHARETSWSDPDRHRAHTREISRERRAGAREATHGAAPSSRGSERARRIGLRGRRRVCCAGRQATTTRRRRPRRRPRKRRRTAAAERPLSSQRGAKPGSRPELPSQR